MGKNAIVTLGRVHKTITLGSEPKYFVFDVLSSSGKPTTGKQALGEFRYLLDLTTDALINKTKDEVVPCFHVEKIPPEVSLSHQDNLLWVKESFVIMLD